jgi:hypothetical protein
MILFLSVDRHKPSLIKRVESSPWRQFIDLLNNKTNFREKKEGYSKNYYLRLFRVMSFFVVP